MVNTVIKQLNYRYMKRLKNFREKREIQGKNKKPLSESVWKTDNGMLLKKYERFRWRILFIYFLRVRIFFFYQ